MARPAVASSEFPPPYNPPYPQQHPYGAGNNIEAGVIPPTGNFETLDGTPPEYTQAFEDVNRFSEATIRRGGLVCVNNKGSMEEPYRTP